MAILGEQLTPVPVVLVTGDSISAGWGDSAISNGYLIRAFNAANIACHNDGRNTATFTSLSRYSQLPQYLSRYADHIVTHCGINDVNAGHSLNTIKSDMVEYCNTMGCLTNKLWFCTIMTNTTTTDAYATYVNQTVGPHETVRLQVNNWLRDATSTGAVAYLNANTVTKNIAGIIDSTAAIEKTISGAPRIVDANGQQNSGATDGGLWLINGTIDCLHPSSTATVPAATTVDTSKFTLF